MGKKTQRYRTERIISKLTRQGAIPNPIEPENINAKRIKHFKVKEYATVSTQTGVEKKNASTNTAAELCSKMDNCAQTDESLQQLIGKNEKRMSNKSSNLFMKLIYFDKFSEELDKANQTTKFCKLIEAIATENLPCTNLSWKCCLDMGVLCMCTSTTNMRYDRDCVEFFSLFNIMFGSSAINILRGTGHFGSLVNRTCQKGNYDPVLGNYNFPIPSITTLKKIGCGYPSYVKVGFVDQSLDMAQEQARQGAQFVISFDGKMVAQGCKNDEDGDVNLWGRERPSIKSTIRNLEIRTQCARDISFKSSKNNIQKHTITLRRLALHVSRTLKQLYTRISMSFNQRQRLLSLAQANPDNVVKYKTRMSFLHQNSAECDSVFRNGLDAQKVIMETLAMLNLFSPTDDHINLSEMSNAFQLLPPEEVSVYLDISIDDNAQYVKQGSDEWHAIRNKARVSGSTLHKAIGLDTLARQKEHHYTNVCGRSPPMPDPLLTQRLKHGSDNEVNIIATLVSTIMPAYLPRCYAYFEVGPKFIKYGSRGFRIEVSADGILRCPNGKNCPNYHIHGERKIVIEMKSPFVTKDRPHVTVYEVPPRNVPQLLCELEAWECSEGWLLEGTKESVTVFRCYEEKQLVYLLLHTAEDLYGGVKPPVPVRLHPMTPKLKEKVKSYVNTHTAFFVQCSSKTGEYGSVQKSDIIQSAYGVTPNRIDCAIEHGDVDFNISVIGSEIKRFFMQAHTVLRNQASEVVVFMATNKDRIQVDNVPYSFPVAYGMKGSSMTNDDLRYLVHCVREEFKKRSVPLLTEVYDGQWHQYITHDVNGHCLTKLSWRHKWQEIMSFSKQKCIDKMIQGCRLRPGDVELLSISKRLEDKSESSFGNIKVVCRIIPLANGKRRKMLNVTSTGGGVFRTPVVHQFVSVCKHSRPDLFPEEIGFSTCHTYADPPNTPPIPLNAVPDIQEGTGHLDDHNYFDNTSNALIDGDVTTEYDRNGKLKPGKRKKKIMGMQHNEVNILHLLNKNIVAEIIEDIDYMDIPEDATSTDLLGHILLHPLCSLLQDILNQLQYYDTQKWGDMVLEELFPCLLTSGDDLTAACTVKDLKIICKTLEHHTDRSWFESSALKGVHVKRIVKAFGGTDTEIEVNRRKGNRIQNPISLRVLAKRALQHEDYKLTNLQIALGTVISREYKAEWYERSTIDPSVFIPFEDGDESGAGGETVELFSYPETDENSEPLFKTFDYTHILTNMRSHILNRGYEFCKRQDFEWIVDNTTGVLSRYLVEYNMDNQNAFSAMKLFGEEVILTLESNGKENSAQFVRLVKAWHMACDERGITADTRVRWLCDMLQFLTKDMNFWSVPFQNPGRYIKGMSWQTFEAILQLISTRIQLYAFASGGTYNARSVSTLSNESFFSDLVRLDKEGKGYPKACNVGQVMGRVVMLNHFKHKRDKNYMLTATLKPKYPPHLDEGDMARYTEETENEFKGTFKDHFFDYKDCHKSQRCRRSDITTGLQALRGVTGVRAYFKINESRILPEVRAGNKPKGFSLE